MASAAAPAFRQSSLDSSSGGPAALNSPKPVSVKELLDSSTNSSTAIPTNYNTSSFLNEPAASEPDEQESIPVIDFGLLTSPDPNQRSQAVQELTKACEEWGFFLLVNHGVPENLMKETVEACDRFLNQTMEEKLKFAGRDVWEPIRFGTSIDIKVAANCFLWRDFLKLFVHPHFNAPTKPEGLSEVLQEYSKRTRQVVQELLRGISEGLGMERGFIEKAMNFESGFQLFAANLYPPCPQPELAMGIPAHADHGLLTILIQNGVDGLQIQHKGKWFSVKPIPNSLVVNTADQLDIFTNGKYKSIMHRAVVNSKSARMSIAVAHGPSLDTEVSPSPELMEKEGRPAVFKPMKYKEYMELQQTKPTPGVPCSELIRIRTP
ncbi:2-oxoglutarate-dependent dioxygenase 19-like [Diospyros lotus]|uniref:2-oxoglutarate-dependent dioxygenase 19-like n=1 Tax=Diospyros lotus TaxID=55363 RepID=UPI0022558606|nr:2-oxoglutarate-dependent dioxygenase 19-like [Diospyros lotus]